MIAALLATATLLGSLPFEEVSGLAVGEHGVYVHEDSGSGPAFARVDRRGRVLARFDLGTTARDWEDMAAAPDAAGTPSLWFADVGDNRERREQVQLHRVAEPAGDELGDVTTARFTYEDGPHDAEALLVLPGGREVAVVTKALSGAGVYTGPADGGVLRRQARLSLRPTGTAGGPLGAFSQVLVTGGSLVGDRVALRTYTDLYVWAWAGDVARTFAQPPAVTPLPETEQGEAVAWDGDAVLVASEGDDAPLHRVVPQRTQAQSQAPTQAPAPRTRQAVPEPTHETLRAVPWPVLAVGAALVGALVLLRRRRG